GRTTQPRPTSGPTSRAMSSKRPRPTSSPTSRATGRTTQPRPTSSPTSRATCSTRPSSSERFPALERAPRKAPFLVRKDVVERLEQPQCPLAVPLHELVQRGRQAGHHRDVAPSVLERSLGAPRPLQQIERDRSLIRKQSEELHLLQREAWTLRPVEHL